MSKKQAGTPAIEQKSPAFEILIYQDPTNVNWYRGEFYKDGVLCFETGQFNQYPYVFATMEPWLAQAPFTVLPKAVA